MLDAPELQDDFYLNLVDWSSQNVLSVGLGACVYLWSACTSQVTRLCDLTNDNDTVTSVSWAERGNFVAVGTHRGYVQVCLVLYLVETKQNYLGSDLGRSSCQEGERVIRPQCQSGGLGLEWGHAE